MRTIYGLTELRELCARAMVGTPHYDEWVTLENLRYLSWEQRTKAAQCYLAIVGERTLPLKGVK